MSDERHAYTKLPAAHAPKASAGLPAPAGAAAAVAAFVGLFAAAAMLLPAPGPAAPDEEPSSVQAPASERASGAMHMPTSMSPIAPAAFVDKLARASAGPLRPDAAMTASPAPAKAAGLFGQAIGGFTPFGQATGPDRAAIRAKMFVPPGAAGGMAPGAGMGEAITACDAIELAARNAAQQHAHYGPSVAGYGPSVAGYTYSGAGYETSRVIVPPIGAPTFVQATFVQATMRAPDAMVQATFRTPDAMVTTASLAASAAAANTCAKCAK